MAIAYLNEGATSLAAANWSDATGIAQDATLVINAGTQTITTSLDWSSLGNAAGGVESLDIIAPFAGNVYGSSFSPLILDVDGTSDTAASAVSRLRYWPGGGVMYYSANGGGAGCFYLQVGGSGQMNVTAGDIKHIHLQDGAELNFGQSATAAASGVWHFNGGKSFIDTHASGLLVTVNVTAGTHYIKRAFTASTGALNVYGGNVTLDLGGGDVPVLGIYGGTVRIIGASFDSSSRLTLLGGTLDLSQLSRAITFTTATHAPTATVINKPSLVTWTTPVKIGSGAKGL